ncbi:5-methylcytosine restriction system specificity protein McrC [Enterococcus sp. DIV0876]|uniref:5-methylcytosine restriction system specificity protein McrC n=1 Tax=Enterococcus sp. DIV0876 TaxID=2774633 RepID=UPI003D300CAD
MIQIKDNSKITEYKDHPIVQKLQNRDLSDLAKENFIIFPPTIEHSEDLDERNQIFATDNGETYTGNIVGMMKMGTDQLQIHSRFYMHDDNGTDFFLQYLLHKVLNSNVITYTTNMDHKQSIFDLLAYIFPAYLNNALQKGLYKEYVKKKYNDPNLKGSINVARHLQLNPIFKGKISYDTSEFNYDNAVTQLIRHTIEKLKNNLSFDLFMDDQTRQNIQAIVQATPSYSKLERRKIISENQLKYVRHSYFEEYYLLQKLCLQILNDDYVGFGADEEEIQGVIIDIAWLWEEYLSTLLSPNFIHPQNIGSARGISLYRDRVLTVYPDFYSLNKKLVLDAKYKNMDSSLKGMQREDRYQMISYLHILKANQAGIIYPSFSQQQLIPVGQLNGYGGNLLKIPFKIPQYCESFQMFVEEMEQNEHNFLAIVNQEIVYQV